MPLSLCFKRTWGLTFNKNRQMLPKQTEPRRFLKTWRSKVNTQGAPAAEETEPQQAPQGGRSSSLSHSLGSSSCSSRLHGSAIESAALERVRRNAGTHLEEGCGQQPPRRSSEGLRAASAHGQRYAAEGHGILGYFGAAPSRYINIYFFTKSLRRGDYCHLPFAESSLLARDVVKMASQEARVIGRMYVYNACP